MDIPTQYCELGFLGFQQPLNVFTSLFFIFFAFLAYKKTNKIALPTLLALIGFCSVFWHFTSLPLGDLLDTLSITIFSLVTTSFIFYKVFVNKLFATLSVLIFLAIAFFVEQISILNGSSVYILLLGVLFVCGLKLAKLSPNSKRYINIALMVFSIAILFRVIDPIVCEQISTGTHFIWHVLMAFVGYNLILALSVKNDVYANE